LSQKVLRLQLRIFYPSTTARNSKLSEKAQQFASNTIGTLLGSEMKLQANNLSNVHMYEVGFVDAPAEIIAAVATEDLEMFNSKIVVTPVWVGGGLLKFFAWRNT
jgi:uncharacterized protein (DUF111 family)